MSVDIQTPQMSVSDNSTVAPFRDPDGPLEMLDGRDGDTANLLMFSFGKSPYADTQMVSLDVGPDATRYEIHSSILSQSTKLAAKVDPWGLKKQTVPLPELDEAAAHTLVHYLYTGRYQTLNSIVAYDEGVNQGYKLSICVYCAAVCYKLPGLAELAKEKITSPCEDMSISNILAMARDHAFPRLPEDEIWYSTYLEGVIHGAMAEDPLSFQRPDLITLVAGNNRLLQLVWKTVTSNLTRVAAEKGVSSKDDSVPIADIPKPEAVTADLKPVEIQGRDTTVDELGLVHVAQVSESAPEVINAGNLQTISQPHNADIAEIVQEPSNAPSSVGAENFIDEQNEANADEFQTGFEDSLGLDAIEPTVRSLPAPEQFTDEVGFESSKMYRQMGANPRIETTSKEPTKPSHSRTDSFMQIEEMMPSPENEDEAAEVPDASSPMASESNEGSSVPIGASTTTKAPKKNKKQKKKKSSIVFH